MRETKSAVVLVHCREFEKLPDHREIWIYGLESGRQRILQRNVILQLSRIHSVSDEDLIPELERRIAGTSAFRIRQISRDPLDPKSAIDPIGLDFIGRILSLQQKVQRAFVQAFHDEVIADLLHAFDGAMRLGYASELYAAAGVPLRLL